MVHRGPLLPFDLPPPYQIECFFYFHCSFGVVGIGVCCNWVAVVGDVRGFWLLLLVVFWCCRWICIVGVVVAIWRLCLLVDGV